MDNRTKPFKDDLKSHGRTYGFKVIEYGRTKVSKDTSIKCKCGAIEVRAAQAILKSFAGCTTCRKERMHQAQSDIKKGKQPHNTKTEAEYKAQLAERNPTMKLVGAYVNTHTKTRHMCTICKHEQEYRPLNILRLGCRNCAGLVPKSADSYNQELLKKNIPFVITKYLGSRTITEHTCTRCLEFKTMCSPTNALKEGKLRCISCDESMMYSIEIAGREFKVRGYERYALPHIVNRFGIKNVICDSDRRVPVIDLGKGKKHRPDFYIPNANLLIEVKSLTTAGLGGIYFNHTPDALFRNIKRKKKKAVAQGYTYMLLLISNTGLQIKLPKDWESYSRSELKSLVKSKSSSSVSN
ncbi:hypothetical protein fHeYen902_060 [Yersinia phage fHe-Yen9-02]|nr:hypothetical protein fHeYen902_060 [Yersinia phage fHe-Yen9-02]